MPRVIDYAQVLASLTGAGMESLYYNSGAFGYIESTSVESVGWILRDDLTLRPAARDIARLILPGDETTLAAMAGTIWATHLSDCAAWVLPKSHWAYELDFGSYSWLPAALVEAGVEPQFLADRHDGAAVEFSLYERPQVEALTATLLQRLAGSDFMILFRHGETVPAICTVHHHKQLWWTTPHPPLAAALRALQ